MDSSAGSVGREVEGRGLNRLPELWSVSVIVSCLMIEAAFIHSLRQSVRHSAHFHLCSGKLTLMFAPETSMRYGVGRAHREIDRWRDGWMLRWIAAKTLPPPRHERGKHDFARGARLLGAPMGAPGGGAARFRVERAIVAVLGV